MSRGRTKVEGGRKKGGGLGRSLMKDRNKASKRNKGGSEGWVSQNRSGSGMYCDWSTMWGFSSTAVN